MLTFGHSTDVRAKPFGRNPEVPLDLLDRLSIHNRPGQNAENASARMPSSGRPGQWRVASLFSVNLLLRSRESGLEGPAAVDLQEVGLVLHRALEVRLDVHPVGGLLGCGLDRRRVQGLP